MLTGIIGLGLYVTIQAKTNMVCTSNFGHSLACNLLGINGTMTSEMII